jgi:Replication-relaxation
MGLSARVSDRCSGFGPFRLVGDRFSRIKAGDVYACEVGVMTGRVSAQRLAVLRSQLTKRDWELVGTLAAVRLANGTQLSQATSSDDSPAAQRAARRQLARLAEWRVLERLERRQGGLGRGSDAWTYALGPVGLRLIGNGVRARRPTLPSQPMWRHVLMGAEIYTRLIEATRGSDRRLELWQGEPDCWREYPGPYGEQLRLKPDAFVVVARPDFEDMAFVEFDTGSQSRSVIRDKREAYRWGWIE